MAKVKFEKELYYDTTTGGYYALNPGGGYDQVTTAGAALVTTMPGGVMRLREENALDGNRVAFSWPAPGIRGVQITVCQEAEAAAGTDIDAIAVCFDAPNDAVADTWLTAGDSRAADSQRFLIKASGEPQEFVFTSPVTRLDLKRDIGANALRVVAAAVEV